MKLPVFFFMATLVLFFSSCSTKKNEGLVVSDGTLFNIAQTASAFTYYKNSSDTLLSDPSSPHGGYMKVRFNQKAMTVMNDSANRLLSPSFPDGSMVVKEIYNQPGGVLIELAVMYKVNGAINTGGGWVWSEFLFDGTVEYSTANSGASCIGCHQGSSNMDLIRVFYTH